MCSATDWQDYNGCLGRDSRMEDHRWKRLDHIHPPDHIPVDDLLALAAINSNKLWHRARYDFRSSLFVRMKQKYEVGVADGSEGLRFAKVQAQFDRLWGQSMSIISIARLRKVPTKFRKILEKRLPPPLSPRINKPVKHSIGCWDGSNKSLRSLLSLERVFWKEWSWFYRVYLSRWLGLKELTQAGPNIRHLARTISNSQVFDVRNDWQGVSGQCVIGWMYLRHPRQKTIKQELSTQTSTSSN